MEPINEIILVTVTNYSGTDSSDKNGENPVMLQCVAGRMPNRNVLSGTVALRAGFEVGKTYLVNVRENGTDKIFGQDFNFIKIKELTEGLDIVKSIKELGAPQILNIQRPEEFESANYQRKTNAIEGARTLRIKEGLYTPAYGKTSSDHHTASEVKEGSTASATEALFGKSLVDELEKKPETKA